MAGRKPKDAVIPVFTDGQENNVDNLTLTQKTTSTSAAAQTIIAAGTAAHKIYGMCLTAAGTVKVSLGSTVATTTTVIRAFNMIAGVPIVLPVQKNGQHWFETGTAGILSVSPSATADISYTFQSKNEEGR